MDAPFVVAFVVGVTPGKWARVWAERLPEHPLSLVQLSPEEALTALAEGAAQVALVRLPVDDDRLNSIPLYVEEAFVAVPKGHPIEALDALTLADLADENVLEGDWESAIELVAANVGVAVMPQSVSRALGRRDVIARPLTDAPTTQVALVWVSETETALTEEFVGIVRGRTANSSRGSDEAEPETRVTAPQKPRKKKPVANLPKGPTPKKKYRKKR